MPMSGVGNGLAAGGGGNNLDLGTGRDGIISAKPNNGNTMSTPPQGIVGSEPSEGSDRTGADVKSGTLMAAPAGASQNSMIGKPGLGEMPDGIVGAKPQGGGTTMRQIGLLAKPQKQSGVIATPGNTGGTAGKVPGRLYS